MNICCQLSFEKNTFLSEKGIFPQTERLYSKTVLETGYYENDLYTTNIYGILQEIVVLFDIKMLLLPIKNRCDSLKK